MHPSRPQTKEEQERRDECQRILRKETIYLPALFKEIERNTAEQCNREMWRKKQKEREIISQERGNRAQPAAHLQNQPWMMPMMPQQELPRGASSSRKKKTRREMENKDAAMIGPLRSWPHRGHQSTPYKPTVQDPAQAHIQAQAQHHYPPATEKMLLGSHIPSTSMSSNGAQAQSLDAELGILDQSIIDAGIEDLFSSWTPVSSSQTGGASNGAEESRQNSGNAEKGLEIVPTPPSTTTPNGQEEHSTAEARNSELERIRQKLQQAQQQIAQLQIDADAASNNSKMEKEQIREQLQRSQQQIAQLQFNAMAAEATHQEKLKRVTEELEKAQNKIAQLRSKNELKSQKIERLKADVAASAHHNELNRIKGELNQSQNQVAQLEINHELQSQEIKYLKAQLIAHQDSLLDKDKLLQEKTAEADKLAFRVSTEILKGAVYLERLRERAAEVESDSGVALGPKLEYLAATTRPREIQIKQEVGMELDVPSSSIATRPGKIQIKKEVVQELPRSEIEARTRYFDLYGDNEVMSGKYKFKKCFFNPSEPRTRVEQDKIDTRGWFPQVVKKAANLRTFYLMEHPGGGDEWKMIKETKERDVWEKDFRKVQEEQRKQREKGLIWYHGDFKNCI